MEADPLLIYWLFSGVHYGVVPGAHPVADDANAVTIRSDGNAEKKAVPEDIFLQLPA